MCEFRDSNMKAIYIILLLLAFLAVYPATAQAALPDSVTLDVKQEKPDSLEITVYENRIKLVNAPVGSMLEIYSVVGIKVKEIEIKQPSVEYVVNIDKGYYIIRVGETVRKIAIR